MRNIVFFLFALMGCGTDLSGDLPCGSTMCTSGQVCVAVVGGAPRDGGITPTPQNSGRCSTVPSDCGPLTNDTREGSCARRFCSALPSFSVVVSGRYITCAGG